METSMKVEGTTKEKGQRLLKLSCLRFVPMRCWGKVEGATEEKGQIVKLSRSSLPRTLFYYLEGVLLATVYLVEMG